MKKTITYPTQGTCSQAIIVTLNEDRTIAQVSFAGGCHGNTQGVAALVQGMQAEEAIARLEVVVRTMEGDAVTLEESLALYEEGVALCRRCQGELETAEQRVKILKRTPEGEIRPDDFPTVE